MDLITDLPPVEGYDSILVEINEILGPVTYQLKLPESWRIHNVFHATLLQPYIKNKVYGNNYPRPLPELLEGEEVYEVKTIGEEEEVSNIT
jgi:hypothetical protein